MADGRTDRTSAEARAEGEAGIEVGTVCPFCAVGCTLAPGAEGRARGVSGPANPDGRLCEKGIAAFDAFGADDRLEQPYVRRNGDLAPASWDEAIGCATEGLHSVYEVYGPDGLAFLGAPHCTNEENYLLSKLARMLGTNNVDNRARICHASAMGAVEKRLGYPAMTNSLRDIERSDVVLVVGANPADQQPIAFDSYIRPAVNAGTTLVHIDPRANRTTRLADVHVPALPGTDAVVLTALCALIERAGLSDDTFIERRTTGYEAFADSLSGIDVEAAARTAGIDREDLEALARRLAEADRVSAIAATGIEEADHESTTTADALIDLLLLTGNLGQPGTGMNVYRGLNNEQGASDAGCRPDALPGHEPVTDRAARERVASEWGVEASSLPADPGLDERKAVAAFGDRVGGALVVGENPAVEKREAEWMDERLGALDTLVVVDVVASETAAYADVLLPAASGVEKAGTVTNIDRRVQTLHPVAKPPGEARTDFAILRALGRHLVGEAFAYADPSAVFAELTRVSPVHAGASPAEVASGGVQWPVGDGEGTAILYGASFATANGRAPFGDAAVEVPDIGPDELVLVVGSRAGGFAAEGAFDRRLGLHAADAAREGLEDGDRVVVSNGTGEVVTTLSTDEGVREGTAYLHAEVADPLVRSGGTTIRVQSAPATDGEERTER